MAKIMLVEDDNNLREIYGARLLAEGHEIVTAKDGEEALAIAVKEKPELIISDVMMPKISGFDMLDILRNAPETKFTKVIMMTALSQTEDKARADSLGADRYLVKSQVTLEDVARVVRDVLEGKTEAESQVVVETTPAVETNPEPVEAVQTPPEPVAPALAETNVEASPQEAQPAQTAQAPVDETPVTATPVSVSDPAPEVATQPVSNSVTVTDTPVSDDASATQPVSNPINIAVAVQPSDDNSSSQPTTSDENTNTTPTDSAGTPEPATTTEEIVSEAPAPTPAVTKEASPIKVELPQIEITDQPNTETTTATVPETPSQTATDNSSIGPNLTEALQQETTDSPEQEVSTPEPSSTAPTVINGAENTVVEPTSAPEQSQTEEASSSETSQNEVSNGNAEQSAPQNPLTDDVKKKGVIQPINDITSGPDLQALLDAEEKKAGILNPPASSVVTPEASEAPTSQAPPTQQANEHDNIAL